MPKSNQTETEQVTAFIAQLPKDTAILVNKIRQIILQAHPEMKERIKWNHPSFYYDGAMEHFDPKEYKRDIAVFNLFKNKLTNNKIQIGYLNMPIIKYFVVKYLKTKSKFSDEIIEDILCNFA